MEHECCQRETIEQLKIEVAVAKSDIQTVKEEIKGMKSQMSKTMWFTITTLLAAVSTLLMLILKK